MAREFDEVMQAYYKQTAKKMIANEVRAKTNKKVFGSLGTKMTCDEIQDIFKAGGYIIDVRGPVEYISGGRIHNSVNVPSVNILRWAKEHPNINSNTPLLVYSNDGNSADQAQKKLENHDYANVTNIGTHKWYNPCS